MKLKNIFKSAFFAGTLAVGAAAVMNFGPEVDAASYYTGTITSNGDTDYGVYKGKACNIASYYQDYIVGNYDDVYIYGDNYKKNKFFGNYAVTKASPMNIKIYGDDPITAFVKKDYLKTPGDYVLFGNEYGYYVHTTSEVENNPLYYTSDIVLIDYDYSQQPEGPQAQCNLTTIPLYARIVCQYEVITINYNRLKELSWYNPSQMPLDVPVSNEDFSGTMSMRYEFDKCPYPSDGYVSVPVLKSDWMTNPTTGIACMDHVFLSNFNITSQLEEYVTDENNHKHWEEYKLEDFSLEYNARTLELSTIDLNDEKHKKDLNEILKETLLSQIDDDCQGVVEDAVEEWSPIAGVILKVVENGIDYGKALYQYFNGVSKTEQKITVNEADYYDPNINGVSKFGYCVDKSVNQSTEYKKMCVISRHGKYGDDNKTDYIKFGFKIDPSDVNKTISNHFTMSWTPYFKGKDGFIKVPDNLKYVDIDFTKNVFEINNTMLLTRNASDNVEYDYYGYRGFENLNLSGTSTNYKFIKVPANHAKRYSFSPIYGGTYNFNLSAGNTMTIKVWEWASGNVIYYANWGRYPNFNLSLDANKSYIMEVIVWAESDKDKNSKYTTIYAITKPVKVTITNPGC